MFTLYLNLYGRAVRPSTYESIDKLGDGLAEALDGAQMGIHPNAMNFLLTLMLRDLRGHQTWTWVGEDYEIFVARNDS
jgi:hypothetical protein